MKHRRNTDFPNVTHLLQMSDENFYMWLTLFDDIAIYRHKRKTHKLKIEELKNKIEKLKEDEAYILDKAERLNKNLRG